SNRRAKAQFERPPPDHKSVLRIAYTAAHHRVDVHVKVGMFGEQLQLAVEYLQAFLGNLVWLYVVDQDLNPFEPGAIEALNAVGSQQVPVGDEPGDDAPFHHLPDDVVQIRMEQGFAAADGDDRGPKLAQFVDAPEHRLSRHGLGKVVELVAVG